MGTIKRLNEQKDKLAQAEDAMPGAYDNKYDQGIQDALAGMGQQNSQGFNFDSTNGTYRGALSRLFGNAGAGADAAAQTAQQLSGGYGADWAQSAANQSAADSAQSGIAGALAKARADALTQWQQELAGQSDQLDTLLGQDSLARGEYDGNVKAAQNWRGYQYDRTEQARQENSDFWGNVWNVMQSIGSAVLEGYDAYKGYRQQDWENAFAERQYNDNLSRTQLSDQMAALQQAASYKQAGFDDAAKQVLTKYGLSDTMLDAWQGLSQVDQDKLTYLTTAAGLGGDGYDTAAKSLLTMAGIDTSSIDYSDTLWAKQNKNQYNLQKMLNELDLSKYGSQLKMQKKYGTTSTGSRSRSSGSSSGSKSGGTSQKAAHTDAQYNSMYTQFSKMKPGDDGYDYYAGELADAGRIPRLSGTGNPGKVNGTPYEQGMYKARQMANSGSSQSEIAAELANSGLSNSQVAAIMNQIDYEWRGTK